MRQNSQTNIFYCSTKYESQTIEVLIYFTKTFFQKYLFLEETYFYKNFADLAGGENDALSVFDHVWNWYWHLAANILQIANIMQIYCKSIANIWQIYYEYIANIMQI